MKGFTLASLMSLPPLSTRCCPNDLVTAISAILCLFLCLRLQRTNPEPIKQTTRRSTATMTPTNKPVEGPETLFSPASTNSVRTATPPVLSVVVIRRVGITFVMMGFPSSSKLLAGGGAGDWDWRMVVARVKVDEPEVITTVVSR